MGADLSMPGLPDDPEARAAQAAAVVRVLAAIRAQPEEPLPLTAMAEIAGFSPFHFAHVFRRLTGIPPGQFRTALRLERAKLLLLTTDLSVTDVCFAVGYEGLGTFTTRFTDLVGVSPGGLRRLPERVSNELQRLPDLAPPGLVADADAGVVGVVRAPDLPRSLIFVGLFPRGIAQRAPVAGTILTAPGPYRLAPVPDGRYHVLAAAVPASPDPALLLAPGDALRVGHVPAPVVVAGGRSTGDTEIVLRPPLPTEPPLLVALGTALLGPVGAGGRSR